MIHATVDRRAALRDARRLARWVALAAFAGAAACETSDDGDRQGSAATTGTADEAEGSTTPVRIRSVGGAEQREASAGVAAQTGREQGQDAGGGQAGQPAGGQGRSGETTQGDVSLQAARDVEETVEIASFSPTASERTRDDQGRLPAEGDLSIYIPMTTLFPGSARLDPAIENPYRGDANAIEAGERHFNAFNCSGCHAPLGGGGMGPPLSDGEWIHGDDPAAWYLVIMHGAPEGMPAFGSMLPRRAVWELIAYIETLDDIDNYATHAGFDAEHATTTDLPSRQRGWESNERQAEQ